MLSPSSLGFRRLIRLAAVLPILGALFLLPAPAFAGHWALGVGYIGTGNTALTGAGPMPSNYNQVSGVDEPYNTNYDISAIANSPASTQTGGITAKITGYVAESVVGKSQNVDMEMSGVSMFITLTWQSDNNHDPAPATVPVIYRGHITTRAEVDGCGPGASETASATGKIDNLNCNPASASVSGPFSGSLVSSPSTRSDPQPIKEVLTVSNGTASAVFNCSWSVKMNLVASYNVNGMSAQTTLAVDFATSAKALPAFSGEPPILGGVNRSRKTDPSFTRWLPLSFSPSINNQPFRQQTGALPGPWGNINCFYSLALQSEANPDLPFEILDFFPSPGADGTYNSPTFPGTAILGSFTPAYSITDAGGERLAFNSGLNGYTDVHSTLARMQDNSFQLQNAGPPGHLKDRGFYTYSFQPLNGGIGRLTSIADILGNTQTLTWGSSPALTVTDSSSGRQLLFYTTNGYLSSVDAPGLNNTVNTHTTTAFDTGGHLTAVNVYAGGSTTPLHTDTWSYGGSNGDSITSLSQGLSQATFSDIVDPVNVDPFGVSRSRLSTASYGSSNDNSSSDDGQSIQGTWNYTYGAIQQGYNHGGALSQTNTVQDARGNTVSLYYGLTQTTDEIINSLQTTAPDYTGAPAGSNVTTTSYNPDITQATGITTTDQLGHVWSSTLNSYGETTSVTDPLTHTWSFNYSGTDARLLTSTVDPTSLIWTFHYGESGNPASALTSVLDPANVTQATINYNTYGQVLNATVPAATAASGVNEETQLGYNPTTGDLTSITNPLGDEATVDSYDPLGDPLSSTVYPDTGNPANSAAPLRATFVWDAAQQITQATLPDSVQIANVWNGGLATQAQSIAPVAAGGAVLSQQNFSYDTRGRLYSASDLIGTTGQWRYDKNSNPTKVLDGVGNTTVISYGKNYEPTGVTWPDGTNRTSLAYDAAGRTGSATDERGIVQSFLYDNADRLTDIQFPAYSAQNEHFTYDNANRPLTVSDSTGGSTFNYDATLKRLSSVQTTLGGMNFTVSYTWYPDGKRKTMTSPVGTTNYYYNAAGELTSLVSPFGETTSWTYDHLGRVTGQTTTTAASTQLANLYTYGVSGLTGDPSTAPVYLRTIQQTINGAAFWNYTLQHSYLSQLLSQTGSGSDGTTESESYSFDQRGRLASDSEQYNGGGHNYTNSGSFGYDLANNLNGQTGGWTYNADDQVTVANSGLGGQPAATGLAYDAAGNLTGLNGMTLSYDPWGQVSSISGTPSGTVSFTYDFAGRRVSKTVNGTTTYYLYDGDLLIAEVNSAGQVQTAYTWGPQGVISDRINLQTTPQSRFYMFDGSGITRALLDQNGIGLSRGTYSAWGSSTGYTPGTPLAWNGRAGCYSDPETGLLFMGARYYSPSIGRFISRDPSGFGGGINLYSYCGGDPINYLDPLGLSFEVDTPFGTPFWVFDSQGFDAAQDTSRDALHSVFTLGRFQPSEESQNSPGYAAAYRGAAVGAAALGVAGIGAVGAAVAPYAGVMPALAAPAVLPALAASNPAAESEEIPAAESLCTQAAGAAQVYLRAIGPDELPAYDAGEILVSRTSRVPNSTRIFPESVWPRMRLFFDLKNELEPDTYTHVVRFPTSGPLNLVPDAPTFSTSYADVNELGASIINPPGITIHPIAGFKP